MARPDSATVVLPSSSDWDSMLDEFRSLGGVADNVIPARSRSGRGLRSRDPGKPFSLRVPDNLLFPDTDAEFVDQRMRVKEAANIGAAEREFFERYQNAFSWGGGGCAESAEFVELFDSLPAELKEILVTDFGMSRFTEGDHTERIHRHFLRGRTIRWKNRNVLIPLVDLMNFRSDGIRLVVDPEGCPQLGGEAQDEIFIAHGPHDPLGSFNKFGFAVARPQAYSLPMRARLGTKELIIDRNLMASEGRAPFRIPAMRSEDTARHLSWLMVGHSKSPRLSRGTFYSLMREAGASGAETAFDAILLANRTKFINLLAALEPYHGEMITRLRLMAYFQLEAMSHCVGSREL